MARTELKGTTFPERPPLLRVSAGEGGWGGAGLLAAFALSIVVAVIRRPDFVLSAQLWAEDGPIWFQQAHELGPLRAMLLPYNGYYHLFPRLAGAAGVLAGVRHAPLVMNALSVLAYAAPVPLALMLARTRREGWFLGLCAALYLLLPYSRETHFSATNAIWPLSIALFLLAMRLVDRADRHDHDDRADQADQADRADRADGAEEADGADGADGAARQDWPALALIVVCGLSGPFALFLLPVVALQGWLRRSGERGRVPWSLVGALGLCAFVQLGLLATGARGASAATGSMTTGTLAHILGGQIVAGGLLGKQAVQALYARGDGANAAYAALALLYAFVVARGSVLGDGRLRAFVVYAHLVLGASLLFASAAPGDDIVAQLLAPANGQRYWLLPTLCFLVCAAWIAVGSRIATERVALAALLPVYLLGSARDFAISPLADLRYGVHAARYCALPLGEGIRIPINPEGWHMDLVRRADRSCPDAAGAGDARSSRSVDQHVEPVGRPRRSSQSRGPRSAGIRESSP